MGSPDLRISDAHWDHEPFLQKLLIHNETIFRFMESGHLQLSDAHWDHEPNPISRSSRGLPAVARRAQAGNEALIFFPTNALG